MNHPGINRAIPGAILGFVLGEAIVMGIRYAQGLDPWNAGVALVLAPFTLMAGWMWGIGAFNPKLSQHGGGEHHAEESAIVPAEGSAIVEAHAAEHHEEEPSPSSLFFNEIWKAISLPLVLLLLVFGFANIPGGFFLRTVSDPMADPAQFAPSVTLELPVIGTIETTEMIIFLIFVGWLFLSLLVFAGLISFLLYKGHEQVVVANQTTPGPEQTTPPAPVRAAGRAAKGAAQGLRNNLPKLLGGK
jgi:Na+-transporting methylmalonyl-CoA/oxaloacetate decarboxylase gamma subunit